MVTKGMLRLGVCNTPTHGMVTKGMVMLGLRNSPTHGISATPASDTHLDFIRAYYCSVLYG